MRSRLFNKRNIVMLLGAVLLAGTGVSLSSRLAAQPLVTATPVQILLPSPTVPQVQQEVTPTFTPTVAIEQGGAVTGVTLEARTDSGPVNVRAEPDPNAEILGTISAGATYPVTGRYFRWIQFRYERAGSGLAWVFDGLVNLVGDSAAVPEIDPFAVPTADPLIINATQTASVVTLTPGGAAIIAATSGTPLAATEAAVPLGGGESSGGPLPTYTFPPDVIAVAPTQGSADASISATPEPETSAAISSSGQVAPIIPIVLLGGLGALGLLISALRR